MNNGLKLLKPVLYCSCRFLHFRFTDFFVVVLVLVCRLCRYFPLHCSPFSLCCCTTFLVIVVKSAEPRLFSTSTFRTGCGREHKQKDPPSPFYIRRHIHPISFLDGDPTLKKGEPHTLTFLLYAILSHGSVVCGSLKYSGKVHSGCMGVQSSMKKHDVIRNG